jgi:hypothetical protein
MPFALILNAALCNSTRNLSRRILYIFFAMQAGLPRVILIHSFVRPASLCLLLGFLAPAPTRAADLHHFDVSSVSNRQYAGYPFAITVTARDVAGNVLSNYTGPVMLRGDAPDVPSYQFGFEGGLGPTLAWKPGDSFRGTYMVRDMDVNGDGTNAPAGCASINNAPMGSDGISREVFTPGGVWYRVSIDVALLNDGSEVYVPGYGPNIFLWAVSGYIGAITFQDYGPLNPHQVHRGVISGQMMCSSDGVFPAGVQIFALGRAQANVWTCYDNLRMEPLLVSPDTSGLFTNGVWSGLVSVGTARTNMVLRATDGAGHEGLSNPFAVWARTPMELTMSPTVTEGDGEVPALITVTQPQADDTPISLTVTDETEITIPSSVILPAGQTSVVFNVTIVDDTELDGYSYSSIIARSAPYFEISFTPVVYDNESAELTVILPSSVSEGVGVVTGMVAASRAPVADILVRVQSSDTSELTVPFTITLPAGQTNVPFTLMVADDKLLDGPQNVTVTATVPNWVSGSTPVTVQDNEVPELILFIFGSQDQNGSIAEGNGFLSSAGRVQIPGALPTNLVISLVSSNPSLLSVTNSVTIPAGSTLVSFPVTVANDDETNGTRFVTVTASAPGFISDFVTIGILDDELDHFNFVISAINDSRTSGVPFFVNIQAQSIDNHVLSLFRDVSIELLSAAGDLGPVGVLPSTNLSFIRGRWSGNVTVLNPDTNVRVRISDSAGHVGISAPLDVRPAVFADSNTNGLPDDWETQHFQSLNSPEGAPGADYDGDDMSNTAEFVAGTNPADPNSLLRLDPIGTSPERTLSFDAVNGRRYQIETADTPLGPWSAVGTAMLATNSVASRSLESLGPRAFVRVRVFP